MDFSTMIEERDPGLAGRLVGSFLLSVGLAFIALGIVLARARVQIGSLLPAVVIAGFGALLIAIGYTFFKAEPDRPQSVAEGPAWGLGHNLAIKVRRPLAFLAVAGCGLMLVHFAALFRHTDWPPLALLWILTALPAAISLLTARMVAPFRFRWFLDCEGYPLLIRLIAQIIYSVAAISYLAVPLALWDLAEHVLGRWYPVAQMVTSGLISLQYVSLVAVLHFGKLYANSAAGNEGMPRQ